MNNVCYFCESKEPAESNLGVVTLRTPEYWRSEKERKIVFYFHKDCFEEGAGMRFNNKNSNINCFFCSEIVRIKSNDIICLVGNYTWIHRKCWDKYGVELTND